MISYKLAKQLKEAGFPQNPFKIGGCPCVDMTVEKDGTWVCGHTKKDFVTIPTLSELIEACGEEFFALNRVPARGWICFKRSSILTLEDDEEGRIEGFGGDTQEEAVARLWLEINKK